MYERFFGLVDAPFRLTPDPRYLFLSRKHAEALAHLRMSAEESSGFVCVTGDVGTGKTTLLRAFLAELEPTVSTAYIFNPSLSALELLQTICAEFGLPAASTSKRDLVDGLNRHLFVQRLAGRRSVVVIDEAQALSVETLEQLRLLSNLETTTEKLLRIVLVGQPQLRQLLLHPELVQLNQRITLRWHIGPLNRAETAAYIHHRLSVASRDRVGEVFSRSALGAIHRIASGVPRLVNMVAHRAMLAAFAREKRVVSVAHVWQAYRELSTVPLPTAPARHPAWALAGMGMSLGVMALGGSLIALRPETTQPVAAPTEPAPAVASFAASERVVEPTPEAAAAATPEPTPTPTPPVIASTAPAAPASDLVELPGVEDRLAAIDRPHSLATAVSHVLGAWEADPLAPDEVERQADSRKAVLRRGLEFVVVEGSVDMLRLVDVPAVLELWVPAGVRHAAVVELKGDRIVLSIGGERVPMSVSTLNKLWTNQAQLVWRDFERLGPTALTVAHRGRRVERLQSLLQRVGVFQGPETGIFDTSTMDAVVAFQQSRRLVADAQVGRLTRLVLYGAAGGYDRPTLSGDGDHTS